MKKIREIINNNLPEILSSILFPLLFWGSLFKYPYRYLYGDFDYTITYLFAGKISFLYFHEFPFFSSYVGGGFPLWANPQNMFLSVPQLFSLIVNNQWLAVRISIVALSIVSMLGMFALLKQLEIKSFWCRLFGAIVYTFSGFLVSHLTIGHFWVQNMVYVPWLASAFLRSYKNDKFSYAIPVWLAIMVYGGMNVTSIFVIIIMLSFLTFCKIKRFILYVFSGILLSVPKIFFSYQLLSWFPRNLSMGYVSQTWAGTLHTLTTALLWPNQWWDDNLYKYAYGLDVHAINCYVGILVFILAIIAIFKIKKHKYSKFSYSMLIVIGAALFLYPGKLNPFWSLLSKNMILGSLHMPSWFIGLLVLPITYFSTIALSNFSGIFKKKTNLILLGICAFIFWDYFRVNKPNLDIIQTTCTLNNKAHFDKNNLFEHNKGPDWNLIVSTRKSNVGFESDIMSTYIQDNEGVLQFYDGLFGYDEYGFLRHSSVKDGPLDLFNKNPNVKIEWVSPSKISVEILNVQKEPMQIPINLNYFPGWKVAGNMSGVTLNKTWSPGNWGLLTVYIDENFPFGTTQKILLKYSPFWKIKFKKEFAGIEQKEPVPVSAEGWYKKGEKLYESYDFESAVVAFDNAIKINPNYISAWESKGWVMCKLKKRNEMIACFDKVSILQKNYNEYIKTAATGRDSKDYFSRASVYLGETKYKEAIADFSIAVKLDNNYVKGYYYRGISYRLNREFTKAFADFNKVIEFNSENAGVYIKRGDIYIQMKDYQNAVSDFNKCIRINPKFAKAYFELGNTLNYLGKNWKAIEKYKKATELTPKFADAYCNWGNALGDLGKNAEAIEKYKKAIEINPRFAYAYYNWSVILGKLGKNEEAAEKYKKARYLFKEQNNLY